MKCIKAAIVAGLLAFMTFYYAAVRPEPAETDDVEPPEEAADAEQPKPPVYDDSDEIATLDERRRAYEAQQLAERGAVLIAEKKRRAERTASANKPKQQPASRGSSYVGQAQTFQATAYTAYCAGCSGITRTGHDLRKSIYEDGRRVIATDPRVIPLGSIVRVTLADGTTFEAVASDTGGAIKGAIIDIAHETKAEALGFGRQTVEVRMIRRGK
ncbi:3D domain-containing protein [Sporosarcina sp. SAFN-015]|uniref:3D domain-containing protein n=1 Tax=Sporosarcina sp. SAFN-015 TaxID=3387274 RepID=UPI003F7D0907